MNEDFYRASADKFVFNVKKGLLYTEDNVWTEITDGEARFGVTDFLQRRGGDIVFVELPKKGYTAKRGEEIASFETIKAVVSITSPFDGTITEANSALSEKPELINKDPYGEGWIASISPFRLEEDRRYLLTAERYFEFMKSRINNELKKRKREV